MCKKYHENSLSVCGLAISSWATMVPFVKDKLRINDGSLGLRLLFLGAGAIITMPLIGWLLQVVIQALGNS